MKNCFSTRHFFHPVVLTTLIVVTLAVTVAQFRYPQGARTEPSLRYDSDGTLVITETRYDEKNRVVEKKESVNGKVRKRTTYIYHAGFKEPDTATTTYQPDGTTNKATSSIDHDKDGNPTITITTEYDKKGKDIGGTKRERDPNTGKDSCYKWNAKTQQYEPVECSQIPTAADVDKSRVGKVSANENAEVGMSPGLQTITFHVPQGNVVLRLPDDMMAGDTISGTVLEEPKGRTEEEHAKNRAVLDALVVELEGTKVPANSPGFKWVLPSSQ